MINKQSLANHKMSFRARGLWAFCLSRPDDWTFHVSELIKQCQEGRKAVYSAIEELMEHGYVLRTQPRIKRDDGRVTFGETEYIFFESPQQSEEFKKSFPLSLFGEAQNVHAQKEQLLSKDFTKDSSSSKEDSSSNKEREKESASPPTPTFWTSGRVKIEESKKAKLLEDLGQERFDEMVARLEEYADLNPKRFKQYASHCTVIRKWDREDSKKQTEKNPAPENPNVKINQEFCNAIKVAAPNITKGLNIFFKHNLAYDNSRNFSMSLQTNPEDFKRTALKAYPEIKER